METSNNFVRLVAGFEKGPKGESPALRAYQCSAGVWTIGWGHTKGVTPGMTCTRSQAVQWLLEDSAEAAAAVRRLVKVPLTQNQFDALVSLVFNTGPDPLTKTLGKRLNAGDYEGAAVQFSKWIYAKGKKLNGLVARRKAEATLFRSK